MTRFMYLLALALLACTVQAPATFAATFVSSDGSAPNLNMVLSPGDRIFAATIGLNAADVPARKHVYYSEAGRLIFNGPIYLTGYAQYPNVPFQPFTPRLLANEPWFNQPNEFEQYALSETKGIECCFYHPCPEDPTYPLTFDAATKSCEGHRCQTEEAHNFEITNLYYPPPFGTFDGNIIVKDKHGGSTGDALFLLNMGPVFFEGQSRNFHIVFRYSHPGRWRNEATQLDEDKFPGDVVDTRVESGLSMPIVVKTKIVHHTSSDMSGTTPGSIDSSDLSLLTSHMRDPCVGYGTVTSCQYFNWYCDLNADGVDVDSSDLSVFASESGRYE